MPPTNATDLEIFKTLLNLIILAFTWFVGTRVIHYWEIRKKQKEQNILSSAEFHKLYGEFTTVWRLWKVLYDNFPGKDSLREKHEERYWELLKRAAAVEGGMESVFIKLAAEKTLEDADLNALGLFRQAIQQLRQSIRDFSNMNWQRGDRAYILLKDLTITTTLLINKPSAAPDSTRAKLQLSEITKPDSNAWKLQAGNN